MTGDAAAVFDAQRARLFGLAYRMLGSASDAEDVLQDAFLRWDATDRDIITEPGTRGGHLLEGRVWPTLEVVIREAPAELRKTLRPDIGLALIDLDRS